MKHRKLQEFSEQCKLTCIEDVFGSELQNFADLIIRECASIANVAQENHCEDVGGNVLAAFGTRA
jgi:hypothetical protein